MTAFLVCVSLLGGASRGDELVLLLLRPLAVAAMLGWVLACPRADWQRVRMPLILLGCWAVVTVMQLIPLPPTISLALPGHAHLSEAAQIAGIAQPWRPISIDPTATWNALFALLVPAALLIGMAHVDPRRDQQLVFAIVAIALVSALMGLLQVSAAGIPSLYRVTSPDLPVGLFVNRNHQAVFLAACLPLLATVAIGWSGLRAWALALGGGLLLLATIFDTGSRSGLVLALIGLMLAAWIVVRARWHSSDEPRTSRRVLMIAGAVAGAVLLLGVLAVMAQARGLAFERLFGTDIDSEERIQALPTVLRVAMDYFPLGTGMGAFDRSFRIAESDQSLHLTYFNHAHNDWLEVWLTGGLPAILVLAAFLVWLSKTIIRQGRRGVSNHLVSMAAFIVFLLGASITDYPLRTPLLATMLILCCVLLPMRQDDGEVLIPER